MLARPHSSYTRTADERLKRPQEIRPLRFDDLIQLRDGPLLDRVHAGNYIVPLEAAEPGDTQVLAAAEPRTHPGSPLLALDSLADFPSLESIVVSTDISLGTTLDGVRELLLQDLRPPIPTEQVLRSLPHLESLHAVSAYRASASRRLELSWLANLPMKDLAVAWDRLATGELGKIGALSGLQRLMVDAGPADSVASIGRLRGLTYLRLRGGRSGWTSLKALENLDAAYLYETGIADLRLAEGWSRLRTLSLHGRRFKSLNGIQDLRALEWCALANVSVTDLASLRHLPALAFLHLDGMRVHDLAPLADLPVLRELTLHQPIGGRGWEVRSLAPLNALPLLESVELQWVTIGDRDLSPLERLPKLRRLGLMADNDEQLLAFRRARPDVDVEVFGSGPQGEMVGAVQIHAPGDAIAQWWIFQDLTRELGTKTNAQAEVHIRNAIRKLSPELLARITFDTEAGGVGLSASQESDIRELARLIGELTGSPSGL